LPPKNGPLPFADLGRNGQPGVSRDMEALLEQERNS
jgi:hypothetical protein